MNKTIDILSKFDSQFLSKQKERIITAISEEINKPQDNKLGSRIIRFIMGKNNLSKIVERKMQDYQEQNRKFVEAEISKKVEEIKNNFLACGLSDSQFCEGFMDFFSLTIVFKKY